MVLPAGIERHVPAQYVAEFEGLARLDQLCAPHHVGGRHRLCWAPVLRGGPFHWKRLIKVRSPDRNANGAVFGRPKGTPAATVCTGLRWTLPSRLLLRVSTNDTGPSTTSMMATSPGAPTCRLPSLGVRLITAAGLIVAMATTSSSEKPSPMNLLMTQVR